MVDWDIEITAEDVLKRLQEVREKVYKQDDDEMVVLKEEYEDDWIKNDKTVSRKQKDLIIAEFTNSVWIKKLMHR